MSKKSGARRERLARKYGRVLGSGYIAPNESDVFGFLMDKGFWQEAFIVAEREGDARSFGTVRRFWFSLVEFGVDELGAALDTGLLDQLSLPELMAGWLDSLKSDYDDVPKERLMRLAGAVAAMCFRDFEHLGYEVIRDEELCRVVRPAKAA
jgi:hypothetical protein